MITQCKNCAGQLVFDPGKQMLVCSHCASEFKPEDFTLESKKPLIEAEATPINEITGDDSKDLMDCYVYICKSCGGEIVINGSEASTKCIYCGNSAVIFSRISKQKRPRYIIPFMITKDEAVSRIRQRFDKGLFIPREVKNFKADNVRGIYVPYWLVNCDHKEAAMITGTVGSGKSSRTVYYGRAGKMKINDLPLDASKLLSDDSSSRLEPYDLTEMKPFDEDYLLGFYSNVSDITYDDLSKAAANRAKYYFDQAAVKNVSNDGVRTPSVNRSYQCTAIDYSALRLAMFPAWFVTYEYKGTHNTIIVNGQTGKIVCGVPWNSTLYYSLLVGLGTVLTTAMIFFFARISPYIFTPEELQEFPDIRFLIFVLAISAGLFSAGAAKVRKVVQSLELTQAGSIFNFVRKRQE